jgi:hypothetical protein
LAHAFEAEREEIGEGRGGEEVVEHVAVFPEGVWLVCKFCGSGETPEKG